MNKRISIFFSLLMFFSLLFTGCSQRQTIYFFHNREYFKVFEDKLAIQELIKKKFYRDFFMVREIRIKSLNNIEDELLKLKKDKSNYFVFLDGQLSPLLETDNEITDNSGARLITYNTFRITSETKIPIFNITYDYFNAESKIMDFLKSKSAEKNDLSDCGIVINDNYSICKKFRESIQSKNYKIDFLNLNADEINANEIKSWIEGKNKKIIVLFAFEYNKLFIEITKPKNTRYIEIMTSYGEYSPEIDFILKINWLLAVRHGINSVEFRKFIGNSKTRKKSYSEKSINYIVKKKDIISIKKTQASRIKKIIMNSEKITF